jgi:predicted nucleic acid-binding protein
MIVLDTNVLSSLMRPAPDRAVVKWLDRQPRTSVWISAITVLEIRYGLQILSPGRRRTTLTTLFETLVAQVIESRIAPFDGEAAEHAGELMAIRHREGRPGDLRDTMIAGTALAHRATLATRNTSHFEDLDVRVVNPWDD